MNLGIYLALGDSITNMAKHGQDSLFIFNYLKAFSKTFNKIYVYTYANENSHGVKNLPKNVVIIPNKWNLSRFLYGILLPFLNYSTIRACDIFRAYHLSGTVPAIISKIFFLKKFVFNYGYNYYKFALIDRKFFQAILFYGLKPAALKLCSKVFVPIPDMIQSQKDVYLPNGVNIEVFRPTEKKVSQKKHIILSIGRLEPQKNYINLIRAMTGIKASLLLIGNGSQENMLKIEAKKCSIDLTILRKVDHSDIRKMYNNATIFVLPSLIEGHPKVLLEAMACGLPVIGSNTEGIKDMIRNKKNGVITEPTKHSIRQSIRNLLGNSALRKAIGSNARLTVEQKYNLGNLLKTEIRVIKECL